jgi:hypothetical protein
MYCKRGAPKRGAGLGMGAWLEHELLCDVMSGVARRGAENKQEVGGCDGLGLAFAGLEAWSMCWFLAVGPVGSACAECAMGLKERD